MTQKRNTFRYCKITFIFYHIQHFSDPYMTDLGEKIWFMIFHVFCRGECIFSKEQRRKLNHEIIRWTLSQQELSRSLKEIVFRHTKIYTSLWEGRITIGTLALEPIWRKKLICQMWTHRWSLYNGLWKWIQRCLEPLTYEGNLMEELLTSTSGAR